MKLPTWERINELFSYDEESGHLTRKCDVPSGNGTIIARAGDRAGSLQKEGYRRVRIDGVRLCEHRVIWFLKTGAWPTHEIDHINSVRDDNRWRNLREASRSQNAMNTTACYNNTSGIRGVHWDNCRQKWRSIITIDGINKHIGYFENQRSKPSLLSPSHNTK